MIHRFLPPKIHQFYKTSNIFIFMQAATAVNSFSCATYMILFLGPLFFFLKNSNKTNMMQQLFINNYMTFISIFSGKFYTSQNYLKPVLMYYRNHVSINSCKLLIKLLSNKIIITFNI